MCRATRPKEEGRIAIVTNAGRAAVDVGHIGAKSFAGRATVSEDLAPTTDAIGVRQNRVVLAPGVCAPRLAVMWRPDRARASIIRKATGAIVQRSPGRARHKPSNHCAGKAGMSPVALFSAMHEAHAVCSWHGGPREPPAPGLPCALFMDEGEATRKARASKAARMRSHVNHSPTLSCPGRGAARRDALQSRGPCSSEHAARWVPALRSNVRTLRRVRDTRPSARPACPYTASTQ